MKERVYDHLALRLKLPAVYDAASLGIFVEKFASVLPHGSTAKLHAIKHGATPPGWDPWEVAMRILDGERHGWSCHVHATLFAALLANAGIATRVDVTLRVDSKAPPVDFHSIVVVSLGASKFLVDPYHAVGPVLLVPGSVTACPHGLLDFSDTKFVWYVKTMPRTANLSYREFATDVDREGMRALCDVSVQFSGVHPIPRADIKTPSGSFSIVESDGTRLWVGKTTIWGVEAVTVKGMTRDVAFNWLTEQGH